MQDEALQRCLEAAFKLVGDDQVARACLIPSTFSPSGIAVLPCCGLSSLAGFTLEGLECIRRAADAGGVYGLLLSQPGWPLSPSVTVVQWHRKLCPDLHLVLYRPQDREYIDYSPAEIALVADNLYG